MGWAFSLLLAFTLDPLRAVCGPCQPFRDPSSPPPLPACLCHEVIARGGNSPDSLVLPGVIPNRLVLEPAHWEEQLYKRASEQTGLKAGGQGGMPTRLRVFSGTANPVRGARGGQADMPALLFRHRQPGE